MPDTLLDIDVELEHALGPGAEAGKGKWKNVKATRRHFIETMLDHQQGSKNGLCYTQGSVANKSRNAKSMIANHIIGFDLDTGETADEIDERLADFPYAYVRYSTHSHMNDTTEVKRDGFFEWCDMDPTGDADASLVAQYLVQEKGYLKRVVLGLEIVEDAKPTDRGVLIIVKHQPMPKWRIVFFLNEPFVFQGKGNQRDLIQEWRQRYHGFGSALGFIYDQKCTDPSRLFYTPRHKKGAPHESEFFEGEAVDLRKYERLQMARRRKSGPSNEFLDAVEDLGTDQNDRERYRLPNGKSLMKWAKTHAIGFEIQGALEDYGPSDVIREDRGKGGVIIECPFEDQHSKPGGVGTFIVNASDNDEFSDGFVVHCSHDGCSGRDRLDFLKGMIDREWLPVEAIYEDRFCAVLVEEDSGNTEDEDKEESAVDQEFNELLEAAKKVGKKDMDAAQSVGRGNP